MRRLTERFQGAIECSSDEQLRLAALERTLVAAAERQAQRRRRRRRRAVILAAVAAPLDARRSRLGGGHGLLREHRPAPLRAARRAPRGKRSRHHMDRRSRRQAAARRGRAAQLARRGHRVTGFDGRRRELLLPLRRRSGRVPREARAHARDAGRRHDRQRPGNAARLRSRDGRRHVHRAFAPAASRGAPPWAGTRFTSRRTRSEAAEGSPGRLSCATATGPRDWSRYASAAMSEEHQNCPHDCPASCR